MRRIYISMKKFLLITYYWPPSGGGGVMRWAKMTKYIREYDWEPIVYTPENGETAAFDESLNQQVIPNLQVVKTPIWEPYDLYKTFLGRKKGEKIYSGYISEGKKDSLTQKIAVFVRTNFFVPDARMFWISPSVRYLREFLQENPVDAIVSTGPPNSMHLIAEQLHRVTGIPWIADFRDPWAHRTFSAKNSYLLPWVRYRQNQLEKRVLRRANKVVTVSWSLKNEFEERVKRSDIEVVTNGFDHEDYQDYTSVPLDQRFSFYYTGSLSKPQNPENFWRALHDAIELVPAIKAKLHLKLVGNIDYVVKESLQKFELLPYAEFIDHIPHEQVVNLQKKGQILLVLTSNSTHANGIIPGKLYECLAARRPIFALAPLSSDIAGIIQRTKGGVSHSYDDLEGMTKSILHLFDAYQTGNLQINSVSLEPFTRRYLAGKFAALLDEIVK